MRRTVSPSVRQPADKPEIDAKFPSVASAQPRAKRPPLTPAASRQPAQGVFIPSPVASPGLAALIAAASTKPSRLNSLLPQHELARCIVRESARTDRTGRPFSLVVFQIPGDDLNLRRIHRLALTAMRRARLTDDIGWYDNHAVAALLPETAAHGAQQFAHNLVASLHATFPDIQTTIYTYPANISPETSSKPSAPFAGHQAPPRPTPCHSPISDVPPDPHSSPLDPLNRDVPLPPRHAESLRSASRFPFASMEHLFVRPLPAWKRLIDIVGASLGIVAASPILLAAVVAIKLTDAGPVFFIQQRAGLGGKPFNMLKLRSMHANAEALKQALMHLNEQDGPTFKIQNDPRITRVGRFIRKTSIDELPQLLNVLMGEMSLVGPRPPTFDEVQKYKRWHHKRLQVTPGLTCIWQVSGRGDGVSFAEWVRMDVQYIRQRNLWQDLRLILGTVPAMLLQRGQ